MSSARKTIENPEVPGLERRLPLLPPACATEAKDSKMRQIDKSMALNAGRANKVGRTILNSDDNDSLKSVSYAKCEENPIFRRSSGQPEVPNGEQPWWIPTDDDTLDLDLLRDIKSAASLTFPWVDLSDDKNMTSPTKVKAKSIKRKNECIDPAQDAERVASAQKELSALLKPLQCDLCNAMMNSTLQAKLHYDGKPHQKKVSMFLNQSAKKLKPDEPQVTSTISKNWSTHCEVCKTWFTSEIDASQHYAGKKHLRATTGVPIQKTKKPQAQAPVDPTGRFGIGVPFAEVPLGPIPAPIEPPSMIPRISTSVVSPVVDNQPANWPALAFRCDLCDISTNRPDQLENHKRGAKHLRMLKMSGQANPEEDKAKEATSQSTPSSTDYSICRTPSGHYYCAPCNRSFHLENSFAQHIESNKHKSQMNPKQPTPAATKKPTKSK